MTCCTANEITTRPSSIADATNTNDREIGNKTINTCNSDQISFIGNISESGSTDKISNIDSVKAVTSFSETEMILGQRNRLHWCFNIVENVVWIPDNINFATDTAISYITRAEKDTNANISDFIDNWFTRNKNETIRK